MIIDILRQKIIIIHSLIVGTFVMVFIINLELHNV